MNDTYGARSSGVSKAEAAEPERANDRANKLADQIHHGMHTHFCAPARGS